jgi:hypothetical protein
MRLARVAAAFAISILIVGGCALFLFESQTFGRIALVLGVGWALMWLMLRHLARHRDPLEALQRHRLLLIGVSAVLAAAGWAAFFLLWEELGLLLVLFGALALSPLIAGVRRRPQLSPLDGPPFGETGPS